MFIPVVTETLTTPMARALEEMRAIMASPLIRLDWLSRSSSTAASITTGIATASGARCSAEAMARAPKPTWLSPSPIME